MQIRSFSPAQSYSQPPVQKKPELREAFDSIVNSGGEGKAALLEDNLDAWKARWKMVEGAKETINAQYFCWDHDVFGMALMGFLYKKAKNENVKMKLMVDATGDTFGTRGFKSHIGGKDYLQELVGTGNVEAKVYHPHWKKLIDQLLAIGSTAIAASNHDKILEVDGKRGMTGGRNIGYEYFVHPEDFKGAWRDTDVVFEGREAADALRTAMDVEYGAPWITQKVRGEWFGNWVKRDLELVGAYCLMDDWLKDSSKGEISADELVKKALARLPEEGITREAGKRELKSLTKLAQELVKYPHLRGSYDLPEPNFRDAEIKILDKTSSVGIGKDQINQGLSLFSRAANESILIENPYIVLTDSMISEFKQAGDRGVEITLGTNSPSSTDSAVTQAFFLQDWPKLLATIPNMKIFVATGERKLHAKAAVIDDQVSVVSTYNLDFLSQQVNSELGAAVWSREFAEDSKQAFFQDAGDKRNGVVEYTILRDKQGKPIRSDGLPVLDEKGELINEPEVTFGPENHVSKEVMDTYKKKMRRWSILRKVIPQLQPLETLKVKKQ